MKDAKLKDIMMDLMGQIVTVKAIARIDKRNKVRSLVIENVAAGWQRAGWVVGSTTLSEGTIVRETDDSGYGVTPYLTNEKRQRVLLVRYWHSMKPVRVPMDGFIEGGLPMSPSAWEWHIMGPKRAQDCKKSISKDVSENQKRDSNGRWIA